MGSTRGETAHAAQGDRETTFADDVLGPLGVLTLAHPAGTFAPTVATLVSLRAIAAQHDALEGTGIDWGTGVGCLAIAAARCPGVDALVALDNDEANLRVAAENATRNDGAAPIHLLLADSYRACTAEGRELLRGLRGRIGFLLANPPSSRGDDGFEFRRAILREGAPFLRGGAQVLLSISYQYGRSRIRNLEEDAPGFRHEGVVASSGWVPFDLERADLRDCLGAYAAEEARGGMPYEFAVSGEAEAFIDARTAWRRYQEEGTSPLTRWETHQFRWCLPGG